MSALYVCSAIPATNSACTVARRFEIRHDAINERVAPYAAASTYITVGNSPDNLIAAARVIAPTKGLRINDFIGDPNAMVPVASTFELASFNVHPRFAPHTVGYMALWAGVLRFVRSHGAEWLVGMFDEARLPALLVATCDAFVPYGEVPGGAGLSADVVAAGLHIPSYLDRLENTNTGAFQLFANVEGLENTVAFA